MKHLAGHNWPKLIRSPASHSLPGAWGGSSFLNGSLSPTSLRLPMLLEGSPYFPGEILDDTSQLSSPSFPSAFPGLGTGLQK